MKIYLSVVVSALLMMVASSATADEINMNVHISEGQQAEPPDVRFGMGVRVGGYGFKHVNDGGNTDWTACRMNGVGVFGTLDIGQHFFTELSIDGYHTTADPELKGIKRKSAISLAAVGARVFPDFIVTPYVQLGGGAEFSVAEVYGAHAYTIAPVAFAGIGGELNLGDLRLGMSIRSLLMPLPIYNWDAAQGHVNWEMEFAGQALFSARYVF